MEEFDESYSTCAIVEWADCLFLLFFLNFFIYSNALIQVIYSFHTVYFFPHLFTPSAFALIS